MADSDNDSFHSAGEEDAPPLPRKSGGDSLTRTPPSAGSSHGASTKKEARNTGKSSAKKAKGKKGKKKNAAVLDEKGDNSEELKGNIPLEEPVGGQQQTKVLPHSDVQEVGQKPTAADSKVASGAESELGLDEPERETWLVKEPEHRPEGKDLKEQDELSPIREDSQLKNERAENTGDAEAKTKSQVPQEGEEITHPEEDREQLLGTGTKMEQDAIKDEPSKTGKQIGESASSASSKPGDCATEAEASVTEKSAAGALGRLTGEKPAEKKSSGGSWGWGGWGASLVSSVSAVGHGLSSVIENVESSLGLPKPQELTDQEKREQQFIVTSDEQGDGKEGEKEDGDQREETRDPGKGEEMERDGDRQQEEEGENKDLEQDPKDQSSIPSSMKGFLSLGASAITNVVGKTVTGGLDALETIGRKTMDVLQEGDYSVTDRGTEQKGSLAEMLRDAKEEAETAAKEEEEEKERQRAHFGILFDQYQGLAHLEALEMISNQSESKVQGSLSMVSGEDLQSLKTELIEIRDAFQLEDLESEEQPEGSEQDFVNAITEHLFGVSLASTPDKLQRVQRRVHEWLAECKSQQEAGQKQNITELHIKAIETLAEFSSRVIEQFHKACELMLLPQDKEHSKSPVERATSLSKLTSVLVTEVSNQACKFADCLNQEARDREDGEGAADVNPLITNVYLEASNSTSYIQDAFQLVLPVLQMVAIEKKKDSKSETT
ncbi:protein FAM114A2-like [Acanthaster planci]|uniref:Protein FAM114A2-like n=1 Tax=Acanthaster planci TaxID=133434 RepID=A0A8B7YE18_ACAPL|nr:protein FAM114A2-like [Acanthaster planci]